jgi:hypothetical protein
MELTPYVESLRADLEAAAAAGGDEARATAALLGVALDASVRLCLVDALSAMAAEVTAATEDLAVEIRMHGREPQVVVTVDDAVDEPVAAPGPPPGPAADEEDDGGVARITLRLPEALKAEAEALAAGQGLSVNAWLVRSVAAAVGRPEARRDARPGPAGRRLTGFQRS